MSITKNEKKQDRLILIGEILQRQVVGSQTALLLILKERGVEITQATLSRDLKTLKVSKVPLSNGLYKYSIPIHSKSMLETADKPAATSHSAIVGVECSGNLVVVKTKPGYASAIAWDIDNRATKEALGTIAGDDTVLVIPRQDITPKQVIDTISLIFKE